MVLRPVELDTATDPRANQPHKRRLNHMIVVNKILSTSLFIQMMIIIVQTIIIMDIIAIMIVSIISSAPTSLQIVASIAQDKRYMPQQLCGKNCLQRNWKLWPIRK